MEQLGWGMKTRVKRALMLQAQIKARLQWKNSQREITAVSVERAIKEKGFGSDFVQQPASQNFIEKSEQKHSLSLEELL